MRLMPVALAVTLVVVAVGAVSVAAALGGPLEPVPPASLATSEPAASTEEPARPADVDTHTGPGADDQADGQATSDGAVGPAGPSPLAAPPPPDTILRRDWTREVEAARGPATLRIGDSGREVVEVQERLAELGYLRSVDGEFGPATHHAVVAAQKVAGITRDGVVGPVTLEALATDAIVPELRGGEATRIEADLDAQVVHLVVDGARIATFDASSGNGEPYVSSAGRPANALTPVGDFRIQRRISGVRESTLGTLYDPLYYLGGWALHGAVSVPAWEASHGCIRLTRADARWLGDQVPNGTQVRVYGGRYVFWA